MRPDLIDDLRHNAADCESCGQPGRAAQLRETADALDEQQRTITRLVAALKSLIPVAFTSDQNRAAVIEFWEQERELGDDSAEAVLEAYAALAEAEKIAVSKGARQ